MQFAYNIAIIHESPKIFVKFCKILYFCTEISKIDGHPCMIDAVADR